MPKLEILLVDGQDAISRIIVFVLNRAGYKNVTRVADHQQAQARMRETRFDLLMIKPEVPGMEAQSFINLVRADPDHGTVPIILVTAGFGDGLSPVSLLGVDDSIIEPFSAEIIREKISSVLQKADQGNGISKWDPEKRGNHQFNCDQFLAWPEETVLFT